ncbi:hypothetical protein O3M35_005693 [Rhynocoris fuscipes]|uniref:Brain-enriched guanylate kinase-associated protein n=1 Tax=Rhynocoris fuscipes TaxID=488301 RepID=A0AAW1DR50_9HEMI
MSLKVKACDGCGCHCQNCHDQTGLHLHLEIENLKQQLLERENHILSMETNFLKEADKFPNGEMAALSEELLTWQEKYSRLYEAHKRVQKVNQNLEDKLLRIVDKCETEKNALTAEVSNLTRRLVDEKFNVSRLQEENERYRNDVNLAIQLLQCKPSNFVSQKYDSLPSEMQQKVRNYISSKRRQSDGNGNVQPKAEMKTIKVPIPTYPPTAMVYSVNKGNLDKEVNNAEDKGNQQGPVDIVSAAIMAKILEEREKERSQTKHCETCTCTKTKCYKSTQTCGEPDKCVVNIAPTNKTHKLGVSSVTSISSLRSRPFDRDKYNHNLLGSLEREVKTESSRLSGDNWDMTSENSLCLKNKTKPCGTAEIVAEGILSVTSESSSSSWQSKLGNGNMHLMQPNTKQENTSDSASDLISFDKPLTKQTETEPRITGPRHCSVRMQVGSNNILLDNVVDPFTPVLYKSKNTDPLVHTTRSRSESSNSSGDEPVTSLKKTPFRTETEI